jgi:hypothetical protein
MELPDLKPESFIDVETLALQEVPMSDALGDRPAIFQGAVMGLVPAGNQGLVRDTREMIESDRLEGPVRALVEAGALLNDPTDARAEDVDEAVTAGRRQYDKERFVTLSDPFQGLAVSRSSEHPVLVMHGPPGTGKSQTITNMIADHLSRGERILFVCDKRTALDVVMNRLAGQGLDALCAVVHDPARDQRELYMKLRGRLDELTELKPDKRADEKVAKLDAELTELHGSLWSLYEALMQPMEDQRGLAGESTHQLIGRWLTLDGPSLPDEALQQIDESSLDQRRQAIEVALERASAIGFAQHPWKDAAAGGVDVWLTRSRDEAQRKLAGCVATAEAADATHHADIPPFGPTETLGAQATRREALLRTMQSLQQSNWPTAEAQRVASLSDAEARELNESLRSAEASRSSLNEPLDPELWEGVKDQPPMGRALVEQLGVIEQYLEVAGRWYAFLAFGAKRAARRVLQGYGLALKTDPAQRVKHLLLGLRARGTLTTLVGRCSGETFGQSVLDDATLKRRLTMFEALLKLRELADGDGVLRGPVKQSLTDAPARAVLMEGLTRSAARADALITLEQTLDASQLFSQSWRQQSYASWRRGDRCGETMGALQQRVDELEAVLRVREAIEQSPEHLRKALTALIDQGASPAEGWCSLQKALVSRLLRDRLGSSPELARLDPAQVDHSVQRIAELEGKKRKAVRDAVLTRWLSLQQQRLLAGTGSRLNNIGAALRQRLFVRGSKAMRLRQMLAVGRQATYEDGGGDPLFDLVPVWLCSPETVAQVFPREAMFDVVVFDEASQVRLEDSLPVLTRAKRVVIAGDTKQLPPTRFFEAGIATSDDVEIETEDQLFEVQQREVEDLLTAALNLNVQESYLNVHYRSKQPELIGFSNEYFYGGRLQAVPGHPDRRIEGSPVELVAVNGAYADRENKSEARRVVDLVEQLLSQRKPPSIGIACFNLVQRDLIVELLDEKAEQDPAFGKRLAEARELTRDGSYEGLFVKNLENVQGDERDHMIISTTYGPNTDGRFYRRFGPLALQGGGRRLNVLVTRAREKVWVLTSVPPEVYRVAEPVPQGATPGGPWLLMAFLRYAERITELYSTQPSGTAIAVDMIAAKHRSNVAHGLGQRLGADAQRRVDVGWGNEGFCVDLVLRQDSQPACGVLCDLSRYSGAGDPVAWDIFRDGILRWQGWQLRRLWSPRVFRDVVGELSSLTAITQEKSR